ncbi:hypothetical protein LWI28_010462 [Acer negundo]|uniref:Uncharacterized protein n=1 Tax=Acer negundo TaxID=4023 RepID=A0AAD5J9S8_ACENE|nr:hypothetical protein LWI28_010462 [Acer negundo]
MEEEYGSRGSQTGISLQTMANSGNVLAEISNIVSYRKNSSSTISNKYLKDDDMVKTCFNKPFKETMPQKRVVGKGRKNNKGKLHVTDSQTSDMVEVLEDSDVLKSLHKEVIGVVSFDNQSVLPIADYNSSLLGMARFLAIIAPYSFYAISAHFLLHFHHQSVAAVSSLLLPTQLPEQRLLQFYFRASLIFSQTLL